jgi:glutaredoxin
VNGHSVTLYTRAGCHLCEEVAVLLDRMLGADRYAAVDIDADDDLLVRYGHRVPVIAVDGRDRLEAPITSPDVASLVREVGEEQVRG